MSSPSEPMDGSSGRALPPPSHDGGGGRTRTTSQETSAPSAGGTRFRTKLSTPDIGTEISQRPRLIQKINESLTGPGSILIVNASAGAGKTTAVRQALESHGHPVAWLTLDRFDVSPGRLLTFLERALQTADAAIPAVVAPALARGGARAAAAELLASQVGDPVTLVIDELEQIADAPAALDVVAPLLLSPGPGLRIVLLSRRTVDFGSLDEAAHERLTYLTENDLSFTIEEARIALTASGRHDVDVDEIVSATDGWVTGVVYGAWGPGRHVHRAGTLDDSLSQEILGSLSPAASELLVETSLLDRVTREAARRLDLPAVDEGFAELRRHHLPLDFLDEDTFRCHPRFREYLQAQLVKTQAPRRRAIHSAHAEMLRLGGDLEEAVHASLQAGDIEQAEETAAAVVMAVAQRLDYDILETWLDAFRPWRVEASEELTAAELLLAIDREHFGHGALCSDRLQALTERNGHRLAPSLVGPMAWCYFVVGRIAAAERVLEAAPHTLDTDVIRFAIGVELVDNATHYRDRPADSGTSMDGLLARVDLAHGRFESLLSPRPTESVAITLSRAGALYGLGDLDGAREIFDSTPGSGWTRIRLWAEFMAECGQPEEAWAALIGGREHLIRSGAGLYRMFAWLTEAMLALRFSRDTALATAALRAAEREPTAMRRVRVLEQLALWHGLVGLLDGNTTAAVHHLREAVGVMTYWDRRLLLPRAAVYLAEAEWRNGDESAAERAANLALKAARMTGSRYGLIQALREFPDVLSRQIDAALDPDSPWHGIGRSMLGSGTAWDSSEPTVAQVVEFTSPGVRVNGRCHELALVKSAELLSYLAFHGGTAERDEIISDLFDSKSSKSAQAYLRVALSKLRAVPGLSESIRIEGSSVSWCDGRLTTDMASVEEALSRLERRMGQAKYDEALALRDRLPAGEYLPGARSRWVNQRRDTWERLVVAVHQAAAEAAYDCSDYLACHRMATDVLRRDPFRESTWRLKMRAAAALGDGDQVIAIFRDCERALADVPAKPADSTRRLLEQLRL
ncbi:hypothetical protein OG404_03850 [Streptomyces griseoaurantiacus]|uniref:BTAD domain-containing putative transcriptional regulator n=1 Tax=Streptomyces griseoaurantiacus TaxID=68213 RepID=UPI00352CFCF9